jgi:hypothetical protein
MSELLRLIPPLGCDELNFSTFRFHVMDDGRIYAPAEAAADACRVGGFVIDPDQTHTVTVKASRLAELEAEESMLRAEHATTPTPVAPPK